MHRPNWPCYDRAGVASVGNIASDRKIVESLSRAAVEGYEIKRGAANSKDD